MSSIDRTVRDDTSMQIDIANTVEIVNGEFVGVRTQANATSQGEAIKYANGVNGVAFGGLSLKQATGDSAESPRPQSRQQTQSMVLKNVTVTGVASKADIYKPVYFTNSEALTLTKPAKGEIAGFVIGYASGAVCDVLILGLAERFAVASQTELIYLGQLDFNTVIDGNVRTGFPMPFHGKVLEFFGMISQVGVGADGAINLNLEIDTVNVTGGVIAYTTAASTPLGAKLEGSAITAANVFHEGSVIDVEGAGAAGTRTSGLLDIYVKVQRLPGA